MSPLPPPSKTCIQEYFDFGPSIEFQMSGLKNHVADKPAFPLISVPSHLPREEVSFLISFQLTLGPLLVFIRILICFFPSPLMRPLKFSLLTTLMLVFFLVLKALVKLDFFDFSILQRPIFQLVPSHSRGRSLPLLPFFLLNLYSHLLQDLTLSSVDTTTSGRLFQRITLSVTSSFRKDCKCTSNSLAILFQDTLSLSGECQEKKGKFTIAAGCSEVGWCVGYHGSGLLTWLEPGN